MSKGRPTRRGRLSRRLAGLVLGLAGCCVVSGCVSVPQSSPASPGRSVGVQDEPQHVTNDPAGPVRGASPLQIAEGFFGAMLAYPQTMTTARSYLTSSAASRWDPSDHVVVYDTLSSSLNRSGVIVDAHALGTLDRRGSWASVRPGRAQLGIQLRLVKVSGQWRVANPPSGLYVDSDYFNSNYSDFSLYFFDPSRVVLAADPVYLVDDESAATALVHDLIAGPTASLHGAVTTAISGRTTIAAGVSTSPSGLAEVPLSEDFLKLSNDDRQFFAAQLAWTLRQLPEIHSVSITVDGTRVDIPGFNSVFGVDEFLGYDSSGLTGDRRLFALSSKGLVSVSSSRVTPVLSGVRAAESARSAAVDDNGDLAALVSSDGTYIGVYNIPSAGASGREWVKGATSLLRPSWDFRRVLWAVDQTANGSRIYAATAKHQRVVRAPGLAGTDIVSFGVSHDGVRFAAIVKEHGVTRLVIAVIHRDPDHPARVSLARPRTILTSGVVLSDLAQLAWAGPTTVVMLARANNGARQPWQVEVDGSAATDVGEFLHVPPTSVASGASVDAPIAVGAPGGQIYVQQSDLQWLQLGAATQLRSPVYAG